MNESQDYEIEVRANLDELREFVREIKLMPREVGSGECTYLVSLLEHGERDEPWRVEFIRGQGYFVKSEGGKEHFETFQALLSKYSPKYRQVFGTKISESLNRLTQKSS